MKSVITFLILAAISTSAMAVERTMLLQGEEITATKKLCFYEGGGNDDTLPVAKSRNCPSVHTFYVGEDSDEDDDE